MSETDQQEKSARLAFVHIDDVPWREVIAQMHGTKRVSVHEKFLEWTAQQMVVLGRYDPGVTVERHGHKSNHLVYVLEGELLVGDRACPAGTLIVLELGARFGPLIAGNAGALLFEVWMGDPGPVPADKEGYYALLRARGIERLPPPKIERPASAPPRSNEGGKQYG
ncbi:MAG: cupin domain-containing protein [Candidatus Binatia bacterium]